MTNTVLFKKNALGNFEEMSEIKREYAYEYLIDHGMGRPKPFVEPFHADTVASNGVFRSGSLASKSYAIACETAKVLEGGGAGMEDALIANSTLQDDSILRDQELGIIPDNCRPILVTTGPDDPGWVGPESVESAFEIYASWHNIAYASLVNQFVFGVVYNVRPVWFSFRRNSGLSNSFCFVRRERFLNYLYAFFGPDSGFEIADMFAEYVSNKIRTNPLVAPHWIKRLRTFNAKPVLAADFPYLHVLANKLVYRNTHTVEQSVFAFFAFSVTHSHLTDVRFVPDDCTDYKMPHKEMRRIEKKCKRRNVASLAVTLDRVRAKLVGDGYPIEAVTEQLAYDYLTQPQDRAYWLGWLDEKKRVYNRARFELSKVAGIGQYSITPYYTEAGLDICPFESGLH